MALGVGSVERVWAAVVPSAATLLKEKRWCGCGLHLEREKERERVFPLFLAHTTHGWAKVTEITGFCRPHTFAAHTSTVHT